MSPERRIPWEEWIQAEEDPARAADKPEALGDLLVLDLSQCHYGALLTATYLGELGAEVIKIEPPGGDPARRWGPADASVEGEGLAPGYLDGLGVGYRQLSRLNPRLVYVACSAYGQFGPLAKDQPPEYDLTD